jgi:hypothetical protein
MEEEKKRIFEEGKRKEVDKSPVCCGGVISLV